MVSNVVHCRPLDCLLALLVAIVMGCGTAQAGEIVTSIVDIHQGSRLTQDVQNLELGGYELAQGQWQSFYAWYHTDWIDTQIDMLTQVEPNFGIVWGASTGESGEKFAIAPSIKLGFIGQVHPVPAGTLSLSLVTILAGELTEKPCTADYGEVGGVQEVNCRLAAEPIPPADTLPLLLNEVPERLKVVLGYQGNF